MWKIKERYLIQNYVVKGVDTARSLGFTKPILTTVRPWKGVVSIKYYRHPEETTGEVD